MISAYHPGGYTVALYLSSGSTHGCVALGGGGLGRRGRSGSTPPDGLSSFTPMTEWWQRTTLKMWWKLMKNCASSWHSSQWLKEVDKQDANTTFGNKRKLKGNACTFTHISAALWLPIWLIGFSWSFYIICGEFYQAMIQNTLNLKLKLNTLSSYKL